MEPAPQPAAEAAAAVTADYMRIRYVRDSKTAFPTGDPCDHRRSTSPAVVPRSKVATLRLRASCFHP